MGKNNIDNYDDYDSYYDFIIDFKREKAARFLPKKKKIICKRKYPCL